MRRRTTDPKLPFRALAGRSAATLAAPFLLLAMAGCAGSSVPRLDPAWVPGQGGDPGVPAAERRWHRAADGSRYYLVPVPNEKGRYAWLDQRRVQYFPAAIYEVERQDERSLWVRFYEVKPAAPPPAVPAAADPVRVAASYAAQVASSTRFTLTDFGRGLPKAGQWREGFAVADLDGDGIPDLVHGPSRKGFQGQPLVFLGDGKGSFRRARGLGFPPLPYDYGDAAVADFDGDGLPDIALGIHLTGLVVLRNTGSGSFESWSDGLAFQVPNRPGPEPAFSSRAIAVADWDGDGRPDLLALSDGPRPWFASARTGFRVYLNGGGRWKLLAEEQDGAFGDGLAVAQGAGGVPVALTGSGATGATKLLRRSSKQGWERLALPLLRPASVVRGVALADLDRDSRLDYVFASSTAESGSWWSSLDVVYDTARGPVRCTLAAQPGHERFRSVAVGDLDGDGWPDVVALGADGSIVIFAGDRNGFLTRDLAYPAPAYRSGCSGSHVALADLDGDGLPDVVASFAGERSGLEDASVCPSGGALEALKVGLK